MSASFWRRSFLRLPRSSLMSLPKNSATRARVSRWGIELGKLVRAVVVDAVVVVFVLGGG